MKLKEVLIKLKQCFTRTSELETLHPEEDLYNNHRDLPPNIYEEKIMSDYAKRFKFLHVKLKYWFIVPLFTIYEYIFGKYLNKEIPDKPWNKNIQIFDRVWDRSMFLWKRHFLNDIHKQDETDSQVWDHVRNARGVPSYLRLIKKTIIAIFLDDTAYRELFNIFAFEYQKEMTKEYGDHANHLFYNCKGNPFGYAVYKVNWGKVCKLKRVDMNENTQKDFFYVPKVHVARFTMRYGAEQTSEVLLGNNAFAHSTRRVWD